MCRAHRARGILPDRTGHWGQITHPGHLHLANLLTAILNDYYKWLFPHGILTSCRAQIPKFESWIKTILEADFLLIQCLRVLLLM